MTTVTGLTAERMLEIEAASVVAGTVNEDGDLILTNNPLLAPAEVASLLDVIGPNVAGEVVVWGNGP